MTVGEGFSNVLCVGAKSLPKRNTKNGSFCVRKLLTIVEGTGIMVFTVGSTSIRDLGIQYLGWFTLVA